MLDVETLGAALKLVKEGGGGGGEGAPIIDDSKILTSTTWSSQKIVDTLCPPFTVSGATVQCTPVANYPLDVQVEITPTQEGTGDPSPENVRPIVGWDAVNVWRGGNNMLDMDEITVSSVVSYGFRMEKIGNYIRIHGTSTETGISSFAIAYSNQNYLYGKGFVFSWFANDPSVISVYGLRTVSENSIAIQMNLQEGQVYDFTIQIALGVQKLNAYEPYQGTTATITLPETIYGGTVDAVTGVGSKEWEHIELSGVEVISMGNIDADDTLQQFNIDRVPLLAQPNHTCFCNVLPADWKVTSGSSIGVWVYSNTTIVLGFPRAELTDYGFVAGNTETYATAFKAYLAAKAAAGTPVTIAYKLATPHPFQATGNQTIPALPGTNTVYTDAGNITVTGASDPIATITALQNRVSALESAALN